MRGLYIADGAVTFRDDLPEPGAADGDVLVEVLQAGVCATDLALRRGYMGFRGIPGHEFVGRAADGPLAGRRVVGDINAACGACPTCAAGDPHHCPHRTVLGILAHGGAFAERLRLPAANLYAVPDAVSTDAATFVEPLAAALEIETQIDIPEAARTIIAGDGRLGLLCAWALHLAGAAVTVAGRHPERRELLPASVELVTGWLEGSPAAGASVERFDLAVEATGSGDVLGRLLPMVRPRGTCVLKTTIETPVALPLAQVVVDEIRLIGSRCGPFDRALEVLASGVLPIDRLIHARYPLAEGATALARAESSGVLKVLLDIAAP